MKRLVAPKFWPIEKKTRKFVIEPRPGPHLKSKCIPIGLVLRDMLNYAQTLKEVKEILQSRTVKVDGRIIKDYSFPVGLMDVISIGSEYYRVLPGKKVLYLKKIGKEEAKIKLSMIKNKSCVKGKTQLNLHDGKNMIAEKDSYKTGDVVVIDLEKGIKEVLKFEKGATVLITDGHNIGSVGKIEKIIVTKSTQPNQIKIKLEDKDVAIPKDYVFVVGEDKPVISLGDDNE
jgi:small subunit ribosomal protein S4e